MGRTPHWLARGLAPLAMLLSTAVVPATVFGQGEAALMISVDTPSSGQKVRTGEEVNFGGWAVDATVPEQGVDRVEVYIDGTREAGGMLLGQASYGNPRPDVARALASEAYTNVGFDLAWMVTGRSGRRMAYVYAHSEGAGWSYEAVALNVEAVGSAGSAPPVGAQQQPSQMSSGPGAPPPGVGPGSRSGGAGQSGPSSFGAGMGQPYNVGGFSSMGGGSSPQMSSYGGYGASPYTGAPYGGAPYGGNAYGSVYGATSPYPMGQYGSSLYGTAAYGYPYAANPYASNPYMDPYGGSAYGYSPYYGASSYYAGYGSSPYYGYSSYYAGYGTVAQPIGVTASAPTGSTITLSWATSSGAASYQVYQAPGAAGPFALVTTSATTSATISGLNPSTTYYYQVLAVSSVGVQSAPSAVVAATTLASSSTTLAPPTGLTVAGVTPNSVTLSWVASSGASHYRVYSSLYGGAQYVLAGSSTSGVTSATVAGLTPATTYVFYVVGVDSVGTESSPSSAIYVVTSLSQGGVSYLERRR